MVQYDLLMTEFYTPGIAAEPDPRGAFYDGIVDVSQIAFRPTLAPDAPRIPIDIIRKNTIKIGSTSLALTGHTLYAMNALLVSGEPATTAMLTEHGFDETAPVSELTKALGRLGTRLRKASGAELLLATHRGGQEPFFNLSPVVAVEDKRKTDEEKEAEEAARKRQGIVSDLVARYGQDPEVQQHVEHLKVRPTNARADTTSFNEFLRYAGQFDLLTAEDEQSLFGVLERGITAYEALVDPTKHTDTDREIFIECVKAQRTLIVSNLRLVASIAKGYFNKSSLSEMELVQEGTIGLIKSIPRFDHQRGFKLSTYATWWIRQASTRAIADTGRAIRLPVAMHDTWLRVQRIKRDLAAELEREPTQKELMAATDLSAKTIEYCENFGSFELPSLDAPIEGEHDDPTLTLSDQIASTVVDPKDHFEDIANQAEVEKLFSSPELNDSEKVVLALRFGLHQTMPRSLKPIGKNKAPVPYLSFIDELPPEAMLTLTEVGTLFGVTRERVRQIEAVAMRTAKRVLSA